MESITQESELNVNAAQLSDAVESAAKETEKVAKKKGRARKVHNYEFEDQTVNLNGYVAICNRTGNEKRFYHSYLANLISKKYNNNFAQFESEYVSREGAGLDRAVNEVNKIENQIARYQDRIVALQDKLNSL